MNNTNEIYKAIDNLLTHNTEKTILIAIDGRSGSGKSTLAYELAEHYKGNLFHMDDFFLPLEMKTPERLSEPGGNAHYERFLEEVMKPILNQQTVLYRPYSCMTGDYKLMQDIEPKRLNIIEGAYSLYPSLQSFYDLKIFLTHNKTIQQERILKRNGPLKLEMFINKWIPLEEKYFSAFHIEEICDLSIDTSFSW